MANEEEIDYETSNLELKYLVAKDSNIIIKEKQDDSTDKMEKLLKDVFLRNDDEHKNVPKELIDDEKLRQRAKDLFSEKSKYSLIKEKVIGITYTFDLRLNNVIKEIHDDVLSSKGNKSYYRELTNIFDSSTEKIAKIMINNKHKNLRTYQFYLSKIIGLFECLKNSKASSNREIDKLIKDINIHFFQECLFFKVSIKRSNKLNLLEDYLVDYIRGRVNVVDINFVQTIWKYYDSVNSKSEIDSAINVIYNWFNWNTEEIRKNINYLTTHIYEIDPFMYKKILSSFVYLQEKNIVDDSLINGFLNRLRLFIHERNELKTVIIDLQNLFLENNVEKNIREKYIKILKSVDNMDEYIINPFDDCCSIEKEAVRNLDDFTIQNINYLSDKIVDGLLYKIQNSNYGSELCCIFDSLNKVYLSRINEWESNPALQENLESLDLFNRKMNEVKDSLDPVIQIWIGNIEQQIAKIKKSLEIK